MSYALWPIMEGTINKELTLALWEKMGDKRETIFWSGRIKTPLDLYNDFSQEGTLGFVVIDKEKNDFVFLTWSHIVATGWREVHFCGLGRYRPAIGKLCMDAYKKSRTPGLFGIMPTRNKKAIHFARLLGYKRAGAIPKFCFIEKDSEWDSGEIFHYTFV